jgi:hypothetical protein
VHIPSEALNNSHGWWQIASPEIISLLRYGFHAQPTRVVPTFDSSMNIMSVVDEQLSACRPETCRRKPGSRRSNDSAAVDDARSQSVTLIPTQRLNIHVPYQLIVNAQPPNGLTSARGVVLDGNGKGVPGVNYVARIDRSSLAGPSIRMYATKPQFNLERARQP